MPGLHDGQPVGSSERHPQPPPCGSVQVTKARATPHAPGPPSSRLAGQWHCGDPRAEPSDASLVNLPPPHAIRTRLGTIQVRIRKHRRRGLFRQRRERMGGRARTRHGRLLWRTLWQALQARPHKRGPSSDFRQVLVECDRLKRLGKWSRGLRSAEGWSAIADHPPWSIADHLPGSIARKLEDFQPLTFP